MNPDVQKVNTPLSTETFTAGGTRFCLEQWRGLTSDNFILWTVAGAILDFDGNPAQLICPKPLRFSKPEFEILDEQIVDFLAKGIVEKVVHTEPEFISNVFVRPKKNGSHRLILNLRDLNNFIEYHHFKMDTIETVIGLMRQNLLWLHWISPMHISQFQLQKLIVVS